MSAITGHWKLRFFTVWTGQHLSLLGSRASQFALVWWLTQETGSATVLAAAAALAIAPGVILGPLAGAYIDRWNRRRVMLIADTANAVVSLGLAYLFWIDAMQVWHVFVTMCLRSVGGAFQQPAVEASTVLMVPDEQLVRVGGFNQTMFGLRFVGGPPLGALLIEFYSFQGAMLVDVITALPAIVPLLFIAIPQPSSEEGSDEAATSVWSDVREGVRFVLGWPGLLIILCNYFAFHLVLVPALTLFPLLVKDYFGGGAAELSLLEAAFGAGLIAGGLILSAWGGFRRRIVTCLLGFTGIGASCFLIAAAPDHLFWMAVAGALGIGLANPFADGSFMAILYGSIPPGVQGRVLGLVLSLCQLSMPLGLAVVGPIVDAVGLLPLYAASGVVTVAGSLLLFFLPAVMNIEERYRESPTRTD